MATIKVIKEKVSIGIKTRNCDSPCLQQEGVLRQQGPRSDVAQVSHYRNEVTESVKLREEGTQGLSKGKGEI